MAPKRTQNWSGRETSNQCKYKATKLSHVDASSILKTKDNQQLKVEIKDEPGILENGEKAKDFIYSPPQEYSNDRSEIKEEVIDKMQWHSFACKPTQLRLDIVLKCGQSFRWTTPFRNRPNEYVGVLGSRVWILKQDPENILYKTLQKKGDQIKQHSNFQTISSKQKREDEEYLRNYFQLDVDLESLYSSWAQVDPVFNDISQRFIGVRMLRQDPIENIFSFICSSNNNIQRISSMIEKMCSRYGEEVATIITSDEGSKSDTKTYYSFPTLDSLCAEQKVDNKSVDVEQTLRLLGFGYRAGYIAKTAKQIMKSGGNDYLFSLRTLPYDKAKTELLKLTGIGPKVADCILLMSLDKPSSIPVDTHMFQIAAQKYLPHLRERKSVTDKVYAEISEHFRALYGDYAGWAHSVLFSADLRHLQNIDKKNDIQANHKSKHKKSKK